MAKRKRKKKTKQELNEENEFLKLKMMAEFGGNFVGNDEISPEVENQFLKQILNFHKRQEDSSVTNIYKFIGEPEYNHVHDMNDKEVKRELKRLMRILKKHGVGLDVLAPTPDREIYRFITEELFKQEIEDVRLKGWVSQYIYEEFHPNADYDVKNVVHYAILSMFDTESFFFGDYFSEDMKDSLGLTTDIEELREKVERFKAEFNDVILVNYDFMEVNIDIDKGVAHVVADITYKTQKVKGRRTKRELTTVEFFLQRSSMISSWWEIYRVVSELF